jgi:ribulose 1,5-bisphosphate synthetase/thiazole synthase
VSCDTVGGGEEGGGMTFNGMVIDDSSLDRATIN